MSRRWKTNPSVNDKVDIGSMRYNWNGHAWRVESSGLEGREGATGPQGATGATGATGKDGGGGLVTRGNSIIMPHDRQYNSTYDFMSSRNNANTQDTYPYNMNKARAKGVISDANGGVDNWTSYNTSSWNYHFMYNLRWSRYTTNTGMKIVCPPNTDIITVRVHANDWQIMSLANANGTFPCREGTSYDSRIYKTSGYGHSQSVGAWGEYNKEHHHTFAYFNVPRSTSSQTFTLIRGHHQRNRSEGGWISGLGFNTNPNLFATANAIDYHWYSNGGNECAWTAGSWNESNMAYVQTETEKLLKVPVAPDNPDASGTRKMYVIGHGRDHNQHLQFVKINGKKYQFKPDGFPIAEALRDSAGTSHNFYVATFEIDDADIPAAVKANGGVIDAYFNNQEYNQNFHFTEVGTYKSEL